MPNPAGQHLEIVPKEVLDGVDALRSDPAHYDLEFENEQVRVLRLTLKGSESVPIHDAQDALVVCLRECHLRLTYPDSRFQDIHDEAGKTLWVFGNTRTEENLSVEPLEMLVIESFSWSIHYLLGNHHCLPVGTGNISLSSDLLSPYN